MPEDRRRLSIALRMSALAPGVLALLMFFVTPTYFRPMFESVVGWLLLSSLATTTGAAYGLVVVGLWLFRKGHAVLGVLALVGSFITWLVAFWIVLLGPAALILMKPPS